MAAYAFKNCYRPLFKKISSLKCCNQTSIVKKLQRYKAQIVNAQKMCLSRRNTIKVR